LTLPFVLGLAVFRGEATALIGAAWKPGLVAGFLFGLEYLLIAQGVGLTSASHIGTFIYIAPIFTALGLHLTLPHERLKRVQWLGVGLAFIGVAISLTAQSRTDSVAIGQSWLGDFLGIASGFAWAATTVVIRLTSLDRAPVSTTLFYQLLGAFVVLSLASAVEGQTQAAFTPAVICNLAFQVIIVSFLSLLLWFSLLRKYLASRLSVLSFMTPIFTIVFGMVFLGETVDASFVFGALLLLAGIAAVSAPDLLMHRVTPKEPEKAPSNSERPSYV